MVLMEKLRRLEHLDYLIRHRVYGSPEEIANRIGVSRSTLYEYLQVLKYYGAKITYDRCKQSFYYEEEENFALSFNNNIHRSKKDEKNSSRPD